MNTLPLPDCPVFIRAELILADSTIFLPAQVPLAQKTGVAVVVEDIHLPYSLWDDGGVIVCDCHEPQSVCNGVSFCAHKLAYLLLVKHGLEPRPFPHQDTDWAKVLEALKYVIDPAAFHRFLFLQPQVRAPGCFVFELAHDWLSPYSNLITREARWSTGFPYGVHIHETRKRKSRA